MPNPEIGDGSQPIKSNRQQLVDTKKEVRNFTREQQPVAVQVAKGASYIFFQGIASNIMVAISFAIIARLITTAEMGIITVLSMVLATCQLLANIGMSKGVTKFIAAGMAINDRKSASGAFYQAIGVSIAISVVLAFALFASSQFISQTLVGTRIHAGLFQLLSLDILVNAGFLPILTSAMFGLGKIREMAIIGVAHSAIRQALIVSLVFYTHSLQGLVVAWVTSEVLASATLLAYVYSKLGPPIFSFSLRRLARFSIPLLLENILGHIYNWFDRAMLLAYMSLGTIGVYHAATVAFNLMAGVTGAIAAALFPAYSSLQGKSGSKSVEGAILKASRYVCYVGAPLAFGLVATARPALTLFVGDSYAEGVVPLMVLSFFMAVTVVYTVLAGVPIVLEETTLSLKLTIINVAVGLASALLMVPLLGAVGASLSRGLTMVVGLILIIRSLRSRIKISFDKEALAKSFIASLAMSFAVVVIQILQYDKHLLPVYVLVGASTYLVALRIQRAIKPSDIELVRQYLGPQFDLAIRKVEKCLVTQQIQPAE